MVCPQGGSWQNLSPKLLSVDAQDSLITTTSIPRNWGGQQLVDEVVMTSAVSLDNDVVKVRQTVPGGAQCVMEYALCIAGLNVNHPLSLVSGLSSDSIPLIIPCSLVSKDAQCTSVLVIPLG